MRDEFRTWLESRDYPPSTVGNYVSQCKFVETHEGDLDEHFKKDRMASLLQGMSYGMAEERENKPNPTKMPFDESVKLRLSLNSYRSAARRYREFLESLQDGQIELEEDPEDLDIDQTQKSKFSLERDMQKALRENLSQLEDGLEAVDGGAEKRVESGRIDIFAKDTSDNLVVIELKAGPASSEAVAQILGYMGAVMVEEPKKSVRGILVASDFHAKAEFAARPIPGLELRKYSFKFEFE